MSAEDMLKETKTLGSPILARRRVVRGLTYITKHVRTWAQPVWANGMRLGLPDEKHWQEWHVLPTLLREGAKRARQTGLYEQTPQTAWMCTCTFDEVVKRLALTNLFLVSHGFVSEEFVSRSTLNSAWQALLWDDSSLMEEFIARAKIPVIPMEDLLRDVH